MPTLHLKLTSAVTPVNVGQQINVSTIRWKGWTYSAVAATDTVHTIDIDIPWIQPSLYSNTDNNHHISIVKGHQVKRVSSEIELDIVPSLEFIPEQFTVRLYNGGTSNAFTAADAFELHVWIEYEAETMMF